MMLSISFLLLNTIFLRLEALIFSTDVGKLFQKLYSCFVPGSEESALVRACGTSVVRFILSS